MTTQQMQERITLTKLAREIGFNPATVYRWSLSGVGKGDNKHILKTFTIGARRYTTRQHYRDWVAATNNGEQLVDGGEAARIAADAAVAERELEQIGA